MLLGLGGPNSARRNVSPPRRSNSRASSTVGARPPSPATSSFNRSSVSGRPASSVNESRELDDSVASIAPNSASLRLREMMEVVAPLINPDLVDPSTIPKPRVSYGFLSQLAVGPVASPTAPLVLGHPSSTRDLTAALNGVSELGKSGKWVTESALPFRASRFGTNTTHVPVRSKFHAPSLLLKKAKAERPQLDYLSLQEKLVSRALHTALHLATTASVACEKMVGEDVPQNVQTLFKGQAVLVESLLGDLLPAHANLTLRQRDVLLEGVSLPERERENLRKLPLFDKDLFPVDFQALDDRVSAQIFTSTRTSLFDKMLKSTAASAGSASKGSSKAAKGPKKSRPKTNQSQAPSKQAGSGGSRPDSKKKSAAKPKGKQNFRQGSKPSENT